MPHVHVHNEAMPHSLIKSYIGRASHIQHLQGAFISVQYMQLISIHLRIYHALHSIRMVTFTQYYFIEINSIQLSVYALYIYIFSVKHCMGSTPRALY